MVQDSLVEYISSQLKLGVTAGAIKASLGAAGWQSADIEDTFKKVEGAKAVQPPLAAKPLSPYPATGMSAKAGDPQAMIRVSDLISVPDSVVAASPAAAAPSFTSKIFSKTKAESPKTTFSMKTVDSPLKPRNNLILMIVGGVLILGLAGAAAFFYMQNSSLATKVNSLSGTSADVASKITLLNNQVAALNASNTAITVSEAQLVQQNARLALELSFYAVPPGGSATTSGTATLSGTLSGGGKLPYLLTTSYGAKIYVQNSKDAKVSAALAPFVGSSTQLSGTYFPGSQNITVLSVNGSTTAQ